MKNSICLIFSIFLSFSGPTSAALLNYSITGNGSGSLNDISFSGVDFSIDLIGDTTNFSSVSDLSILDPLQSAVVTILGFSPTTLTIDTQLGFNSTLNDVFFSRSAGIDLFDFFISDPVDLSSPFGPLTGSNVFALNQFQDVPSTGGLLSFNSSGDVTFSAVIANSTVPEPQTYALLFVGLGFMLKFVRRKSVNL